MKPFSRSRLWVRRAFSPKRLALSAISGPYCRKRPTFPDRTDLAVQKKESETISNSLSSGGRTRTCGLWVMSPTSYQLLHPAISECKYKIKLDNLQTNFPKKTFFHTTIPFPTRETLNPAPSVKEEYQPIYQYFSHLRIDDSYPKNDLSENHNS